MRANTRYSADTFPCSDRLKSRDRLADLSAGRCGSEGDALQNPLRHAPFAQRIRAANHIHEWEANVGAWPRIQPHNGRASGERRIFAAAPAEHSFKPIGAAWFDQLPFHRRRETHQRGLQSAPNRKLLLSPEHRRALVRPLSRHTLIATTGWSRQRGQSSLRSMMTFSLCPATPVRAHRHACQQRRHLHRETVRPVHRARLRGDGGQSAGH
jgi:hypothetical protein